MKEIYIIYYKKEQKRYIVYFEYTYVYIINYIVYIYIYNIYIYIYIMWCIYLKASPLPPAPLPNCKTSRTESQQPARWPTRPEAICWTNILHSLIKDKTMEKAWFLDARGPPCMHGFILIGAAGHPQGQQTPDEAPSRHKTGQDGQGRVKPWSRGPQGEPNRKGNNKQIAAKRDYCKTVRTESQQTARWPTRLQATCKMTYKTRSYLLLELRLTAWGPRGAGWEREMYIYIFFF